ncbi:hypothetical protein ACFSJU_09555 [Paradesertivirga mongoliensis]|uniref:Uncharacterized protein n=1 Tax=Paradesertivirga mongoliensis TaxID=2100740 RepID=A0ABW4ZL35_9SPHI|nr:hypothetical protein [Pedobacter mongoliensis]
MELFREEYLTIQDDYLRVDPSREESVNDDEDVDYSNDDLGENTEITPLGDAIEEDELNDLRIDPDDEDYGDDEDLDVDLDTEEDLDEDDDIVDIKSQIDPDDDFDDDDDLIDDDDDLDTAITPDLEEEDDFADDDDLLDEDDDIDDATARTSVDTSADFSTRPHGRVTGTMLDHEPGLPGSDRP